MDDIRLMEVLVNANMGNLQDLKIVRGTSDWLPERVVLASYQLHLNHLLMFAPRNPFQAHLRKTEEQVCLMSDL